MSGNFLSSCTLLKHLSQETRANSINNDLPEPVGDINSL
jgi:hypothetical protein